MTRYPEATNYEQWQKLDVELRELGPRLAKAEFYRKFRSDRPRIIRYAIEGLNWRGIICCAPLNEAHAVADIVGRVAWDRLARWASDQIDIPRVYAEFAKALKGASIKKEDAPNTLLMPYCSFGAYLNGTKPPFGKKAPFLDYLRVQGWLLPEGLAAVLEKFLDDALASSRGWAFCGADEATPKPAHSLAPTSDIPALLGTPLYVDGEAAPDREARLRRLLRDIEQTAEVLSKHPRDQFESHFHDIVRPRSSLLGSDTQRSLAGFDGTCEAVVLSRIELIRRLNWPTFYVGLSEMVLRFEGQPNEQVSKVQHILGAVRDLLDDLRKNHEWLGRLDGLLSDVSTL